jgi:hypothetical protein
MEHLMDMLAYCVESDWKEVRPGLRFYFMAWVLGKNDRDNWNRGEEMAKEVWDRRGRKNIGLGDACEELKDKYWKLYVRPNI